MQNISLKLIFRSWWRNKTFTAISILSLAVGIACTNLLLAFVIHEYNVEADNPNRDRIYCLVQDNPYQSGDKVFYASGEVPPMIKERYPEVEDWLSLNTAGISQVTVGETIYKPMTLLQAGPSFPRFFPYQTISGNLGEALTEPNKIALTETTARRFFDREDPIGQNIYIHHNPKEATAYLVVAVIKERDQSALSFDAITAMRPKSGGTAYLLMNQSIDPEAFTQRLKEDGIPTFMINEGRYYLYTLQENLFREYKVQSLQHLRKQHKPTLDIGLFAALLILLIACFNYINLNFSHLLQQIKRIHIQRLMGASHIDINKQLFLNISLTVFGSFILSLLILYDLIPVFNSVLSGQMNASFIFSGQVMPWLIGLVFLLSIIPAMYVSRKIRTLSRQHLIGLTGGKKKERIISTLSVIQFTISIVLIIATLTVNRQIGRIHQAGKGYRGLIEIQFPQGDHNQLKPFVAELRAHPELGEINTTPLSLFHYGLRQVTVSDAEGSETYLSLAELGGDTGFLSAFHIGLQQGLQPKEAIERFPRSVYVNQRFAEIFVGNEENPVGKPLESYHKDFYQGEKEEGSNDSPTTTIAGVVDNFFVGSLEEEVPPAIIHIQDGISEMDGYVYFHLDSRYPERLSRIKQLWEKYHPGKLFTYQNVYEDFTALNQKTFGLADLLLMYSLISIFLTCFGLFGMALYAIEQRTKEIGIRKVNGSTTWQIMRMLNRQFIMWIGIAYVIALPIAWWLLNRWMENFVYRAGFSIWTYILPLFIVIAITLLTVSWHSYRAAMGNPVKALRNE